MRAKLEALKLSPDKKQNSFLLRNALRDRGGREGIIRADLPQTTKHFLEAPAAMEAAAVAYFIFRFAGLQN